MKFWEKLAARDRKKSFLQLFAAKGLPVLLYAAEVQPLTNKIITTMVIRPLDDPT